MINTVDSKETTTLPSQLVAVRLARLANSQTTEPLMSQEAELGLFRSALEQAGVNFSPEVLDRRITTIDNTQEEPQELETTVREALALAQMRSSEQGAGPAVVAMIGLERFNQLEEKAIELGVRDEAPRLKKQSEETRARGLMQFLRLSLAFAAGSISQKRFVDEVNQRVFNGQARLIKRDKSLLDEEKEARIDQLGEKFGGLKVVSGRSSIMPGSLVEFWQTMTTPRET